MILVVMAAGMGSRFGGSKQTTGVGPNGEFIIDYSIYDAIRAGFNKVVFIIRKENYEEFRNTIGKRIEDKIEVLYAFQDMNDIPNGVSLPSERVKPLGTGHALLSCRNIVDDNFIIINADDFYGRDSFIKIGEYLKSVDKNSRNYSMVAYKLSNTMSDNGSVSRGVCEVVDGNLVNITERTDILYQNGDIVYLDGDRYYEISGDTLVSLNLWGFTPMVFDDAYRYFLEFFKEPGDFLKKEFYLPTIVDKSIKEGVCSVEVLSTSAKFCGMTYKEDREELKNYIYSLVDEGVYPNNLWN
jgi:NDP-sugar pyrophosphorylase family protein